MRGMTGEHNRKRWAWVVAMGCVLSGCADGATDPFGRAFEPDVGESTGGGDWGGDESTDSWSDASDATGDVADAASDSGGPSSDPTLDPTAGSSDTHDSGEPSPKTCAYRSTTFGDPMQELDVIGDPNSSVRLSFDVLGLPPAHTISAAELRFRSFDADHPGEEGRIYVNGGAPYGIPANLAWESMESAGAVDVLSDVIGGANRIEFGPGPLDRSFFRIGDVELVVTATVEECDAVDDGGGGGGDDGATGMGVEQMVHYSDATYTGRNNWVWRCQPGFDYAYTAANSEHVPTDCQGLYSPDGSAHGTATFHFNDVPNDLYAVEVHAYHTWNRNPSGARIIVDGITGFVQQRTSQEGESYFETAEWGIAELEGDVDIVLDSSQGGYASDAVSWIRIVPL